MCRAPLVLLAAFVAAALFVACEEKIPPILALESADTSPVVIGLEDASDAGDAISPESGLDAGADSD